MKSQLLSLLGFLLAVFLVFKILSSTKPENPRKFKPRYAQHQVLDDRR